MATTVAPSLPNTLAAQERAIVRETFAPRARMSVLEWADTRRMLSPESNPLAQHAGVPVPYSSTVTPYHREPMRALSDPLTKAVICVFPSQDGKTEIVNNFVGRNIDVAPAAMLVMYPTGKLGEKWSKLRLAPMLRDTPTLHGKVREARARDSDNTVLFKGFPGGSITITGSNSGAGLSSLPIQHVIVDEVDRCAPMVKNEGDSIGLAVRRKAAFRRGKRLFISSPTLAPLIDKETGEIQHRSRIHKEYLSGTQEEWSAPCPHCETEQSFRWGTDETKWGMKEGPDGAPHYVCVSCLQPIAESWKPWMNARARYIARNPSAGPEIRSFWKSGVLNALSSWGEQWSEWNRIKGQPEEEQQFFNTVQCELWDPDSPKNKLDSDALFDRLEKYTADVPAGGVLLIRIADVHDDSIETSVWAFGPGQEMWLVDLQVIPGNPQIPFVNQNVDADGRLSPWRDFFREESKVYRHEFGLTLRPQLTFVDSGGHATVEVYDYCRRQQRRGRQVFAIKGASSESAPLLSDPIRHKKRRGVTFYFVGSSIAKDAIQKRLARIPKPGPGFIHLPQKPWMDKSRVDQFTNELRVWNTTKGKPEWKQIGPNEMLDMAGYALAGLQKFGFETIQSLGQMADRLRIDGQRASEGKPPIPKTSRRGLVSEVNW